MKRLLLLCCLLMPLAAQDEASRVFLISLDGFGHYALTKDPAAGAMRNIQSMAKEGVLLPMQAAFPSLTAAGHASLFTGTYGDENGVTANNVALRPRNRHRFDERVNAFRAEQLDRENFWVPLGRRGIRTVAHNSTQGFPCNDKNSGPGVALLNGYQTVEIAPERVLRSLDVKWLEAAPVGFPAFGKSRKAPQYFQYSAKDTRIEGAVYARGWRYDTIRLRAGGNHVDVALWKAEDEPFASSAKPRKLARFFSEPLELKPNAGVFYRLFELRDDGRDFVLYQSLGKEISYCTDGAEQNTAAATRLYKEAGAFIGNGAGSQYSRGAFGKVLEDGIAERRFLETLELHARQTMRYTEAMLEANNPRLLVDYISTTDDMLHLWWGMAAQGEPFLEPYREWGYAIADWRVGALLNHRRDQDHLIVVSDHGMTGMTHEVRLNKLLEEWGYRDRVFASYYGLYVNTTDWYNGKVPVEEKRALLEEVRTKLAAYTYGNQNVFREFYWPDAIAKSYGIGGDRAADLYFDLAPGWSLSPLTGPPSVRKLPQPKGEHGPIPTREDLLSVFLQYGPGLHSRPLTIKIKDIAALVTKILLAE